MNMFFVVNKQKQELVTLHVGGVDLDMIIEYGATVHIVDRETWEKLKQSTIQYKSKLCTKSLYACGSEKPLCVLIRT